VFRLQPGLARAAVQRGRIAEIVSHENDTKKFLLNKFWPREVASQRFSVAMDVIAFRRLIYLTADQNSVFQWGVENN
jgi:hypothetical protein